MADPADPDEFMLTAQQAQSMGLHIGDKVRFGVYTNAQIQLADFGSAWVRPYRVVEAKLVGIAALQYQRRRGPVRRGVVTGQPVHPGAYPAPLRCCVNYSESGVQLSTLVSSPSVISEIAPLYPKGTPSFQAVAPIVLPKAQRSIEPDALALGVFGGIVASRCLLDRRLS